MEKNYFLDRHPICQERDNIQKGDRVFICLKKAQTYAKELKDLTLITVTANLTSQAIHPRGQKVKGLDEYGEEHVGRVTYKFADKNRVFTKDGLKYVYKDNDGCFNLATKDEITGLYSLIIVFKYKNFEFEFDFEPFLFFKYENIQNFVDSLNIHNARLKGGLIIYENGEREIIEKKFISIYNNQTVNNEDVFNFLCNNYQSDNNSAYNYNKEYFLEFLGIKAIEN